MAGALPLCYGRATDGIGSGSKLKAGEIISAYAIADSLPITVSAKTSPW